MDDASHGVMGEGSEAVVDLRSADPSDAPVPTAAPPAASAAPAAPVATGTESDTRARLVRAAGEVFREKGYTGSRVQDIARRAGFTSGALYSHFDSRAALLAEAIAAQNDQLLREMSDGLSRMGAPLAGDTAETLAAFAALEVSPTDQLLLDGLALCAREPGARQRIGDALRQLVGELESRLGRTPARPGSRLAADPSAVSFLLLVFLAGSTAVRAAGLQDLAPEDLDDLLAGVLSHLGGVDKPMDAVPPAPADPSL